MMSGINYLAVVVAALSTFLVGGLWYSPVLFGPRWQRAAGDVRKPGDAHPARVFGLSFVFALVAALAYALIIPPAANATMALLQGVVVGAGVVAASFGINYQFANRPAVLWLIDGGYHTVQFALYGLIIGLWH
jgi:hypothetical protein